MYSNLNGRSGPSLRDLAYWYPSRRRKGIETLRLKRTMLRPKLRDPRSIPEYQKTEIPDCGKPQTADDRAQEVRVRTRVREPAASEGRLNGISMHDTSRFIPWPLQPRPSALLPNRHTPLYMAFSRLTGCFFLPAVHRKSRRVTPPVRRRTVSVTRTRARVF